MRQTIVVVDDEPKNLMLLEDYLEQSGCAAVFFGGAEPALDYLQAGHAADVILLDRLMPGMDGMAFMHLLRQLPGRANVPVILQTAAASHAQIAEGIAAGAYYYLTKPYSRELLLAIVQRARADSAFHAGLERAAARHCGALPHIDHLRVSFRTVSEVRKVSHFVAALFPDPDAAILGVTELMLNAVEHGNLGISYAEKGALKRAGTWAAEVERRTALPEYFGRIAHATFDRTPQSFDLTIEDMGAGFDWTDYAHFNPERAADSHGRGIAMSRLVSFDEVTYVPPGNKVICRKLA